ncbi:hypothetical protein GCM10025857_01790 [Alicyclobacillus contaminans]|uniref:arylamine N-acetyltransferase n=1 Tax=Alicyclobacillus contaminans TaxID=392016 RepID=UPI000553879E|nr:hypothetical protein GCM10025857_01790 [Alicyclobacillus contaminans]
MAMQIAVLSLGSHPPIATTIGLFQCQAQHFENSDIVNGRPIELNLEPMYDKIVLKRRGGYCYGLNIVDI